MASNPTPPVPGGRAAPQAANGGSDRLEHYGTVVVERLAKDDGRALILYAHWAAHASGEQGP